MEHSFTNKHTCTSARITKGALQRVFDKHIDLNLAHFQTLPTIIDVEMSYQDQFKLSHTPRLVVTRLTPPYFSFAASF